MPYIYDYPRPAIAVDCVVFGVDATNRLKVLLIERQLPPFVGQWALPGGFMRPEESLDNAARRKLREETGIQEGFLEQLRAFGAVGRDPRDRVVSIAYTALVNLRDHTLQAATDARDAQWFPVSALPPLAFDHAEMVQVALARLQHQVRIAPVGFELLPPKFTLTQLQQLYEAIWGVAIDKRNFRKKILKLGLLVPLGEKEQGVAHRAAQLYRFDGDRYRQFQQAGLNFEL